MMIYPWQTELWQRFTNQIQQKRVPHALLITGVAGLGKNQLCQRLVASMLCVSRQSDGTHCGQCHSCQLFNAGNHPDHMEINPEENGKQIKIDQIRLLKDKQQLTPNVAPWKTVVISPAENMNTNASNSLLKLLEEPQTNTILILVSAKPERLPITIKSRCQNYHLNIPDYGAAIEWLKQNDVTCTDGDLDKLIQLAKGAPLAAKALLEQQGIEQYRQIEQDFSTLLSAPVNPVALAASWQQLNLITVMNQFQLMIKERILSTLMNNENHQQSNSLMTYWQIADCIIATIKLLSSQNNLNKTLLIEDFIVSIMQLSEQIKIRN